MAVTKAKKAETLKSLNEYFKKAKAIYFANYRGLTVKKATELRKLLKKSGVDYVVAKKTLVNIAIKENGLPEVQKEIMDGPVGIAFGYEDVVIPVKLMSDFAKTSENKFEVLGGLVEAKLVSKAQAKELASLPSREVLLAKLVGSMKSPISGLHGTLSGICRKFVYALNAVKDKKAA